MTCRRIALRLTVATIILFTALVAGGQAGPASPAPAPAKPAAAPKKPKERLLKMKAGEGTYDDNTKTWVLKHVDRIVLPESESVMRADRIEYNTEQRWMRATGKPRLWDPDNELTADTIYTDLRAKRATADGTVRLTSRPKKAETEQGRKAREEVKEPVVVQCDKMEYFYKDKRGTATGNLKLTQKDKRADRTATGERLSYDGNEETVVLEGSVHVTNTKGEGFKCKRVVVRLKEGSEGFQAEGIEDFIGYITDEDEEEAGGKPEPGGAAPRKSE